MDRLPHAIEAGEADLAILWLKFWGSWHHLYPTDRAMQAMTRYNEALRAASIQGSAPVDSGPPRAHGAAPQDH